MADVTITASGVQATSTTRTIDRTAGATVTAGQTLYVDATDNKAKPADNSTAAKANVIGVALNGAADGQPVRVAIGGDVTMDSLTAGIPLMLSPTANGGNIAPAADVLTGDYITLIGVPTGTTTLRLALTVTGAQKA